VAHVSEVRHVAAPVVIGDAPAAARAPLSATRRSAAMMPVRRFGERLTNEWLPTLGWSIGRTGRTGLIGIALLAATAVFLVSTHLRVVDEVQSLRADLATARQQQAAAPRLAANDPLRALAGLPARAEMPAVLGVLLKQADAAHLTLDTGKYETSSSKSGSVVRYNISFPVIGPYPQVRKFIDSTLEAMPAVAIADLAFERKAIGDAVVEARIRLTVFTRAAP
jgi:hypothetical protein